LNEADEKLFGSTLRGQKKRAIVAGFADEFSFVCEEVLGLGCFDELMEIFQK
jgi:hypothetical protein